ncbi:hypothetical protein GCM10010124_00790 [Pilimelia terevasa]|uniref:Uncharacterized protein n=1 Tax=Pilimelia terevasa TaxID=53372 RepID=A0A8J3FDN4_9ACTN|nr:hypothetical protein [Pilimelia terevasa]GGK12024.1 hypothetical protein GCM10010124_00790 [Pilimelia terevasa]
MPSVDFSATRGGARSSLFWAGVATAPVAALLILFSDGDGAIRLAAVLAVLAVVLIGLSSIARGGPSTQEQVEEAIFDESDALREDLREDIKTAVRAVHKALVERHHGAVEDVAELRAQVQRLESDWAQALPAEAVEPPVEPRQIEARPVPSRPAGSRPAASADGYPAHPVIEHRDGDWQYAAPPREPEDSDWTRPAPARAAAPHPRAAAADRPRQPAAPRAAHWSVDAPTGWDEIPAYDGRTQILPASGDADTARPERAAYGEARRGGSEPRQAALPPTGWYAPGHPVDPRLAAAPTPHETARPDPARHGTAQAETARHGTVPAGAVGHGTVYDAAWHESAGRGDARHAADRQGAARHASPGREVARRDEDGSAPSRRSGAESDGARPVDAGPAGGRYDVPLSRYAEVDRNTEWSRYPDTARFGDGSRYRDGSRYGAESPRADFRQPDPQRFADAARHADADAGRYTAPVRPDADRYPDAPRQDDPRRDERRPGDPWQGDPRHGDPRHDGVRDDDPRQPYRFAEEARHAAERGYPEGPRGHTVRVYRADDIW